VIEACPSAMFVPAARAGRRKLSQIGGNANCELNHLKIFLLSNYCTPQRVLAAMDSVMMITTREGRSTRIQTSGEEVHTKEPATNEISK